MRDIFKNSILGILLFILSCSTADENNSYKSFSFTPSYKKTSTFKSKKRIAIQTFLDEREKENLTYSGLLFIPFVPYANEYYNKPESDSRFSLDLFLEAELAKAMETELADYSVFEKVFYTDRTYPKDADYLIRVRIMKNQMYIKRSLYGINTLALVNLFFIWGLVLMELDFYNLKLDFELELIDIKTKQIVFKKNFKKEEADIEIGRNGINMKNDFRIKFLSFNEKIIYSMSEEIIQYFEEDKK